jgi:hypothetical protein
MLKLADTDSASSRPNRTGDEADGGEFLDDTSGRPRNTPPGNMAFLRDLEFHGLKPMDIRLGREGKIAVIGRPMGGQTTTNPKRPLGVRDYADKLEKMGCEVEIYEPKERGELRGIKEDILNEQGIAPTDEAIDALRLPDDRIKTTKSYQNQRNWAKKIRDEEWTVIDSGNNTADEFPGAYYDAEIEIFFPDRSGVRSSTAQP